MTANLTRFSALFRASASTSLEYSISDDLDTFGTMVRGNDELLDALGAFVAGTPFMGDWHSTASGMFRRMHPAASLFRVDWRGEVPVATTIYMKFSTVPTDFAFQELLIATGPFRWYGPSLGAISNALGLVGPTGIALRGMTDGSGKVAAYFRIDAGAGGTLGPEAISKLLRAADISYGSRPILADSLMLAPTCPLSVVGLDGGSPTSRGALKLDWSEVRPRVARALISSKGAPRRALLRFDEFSNILRARWLSYLGMKYTPSGFTGWRVYFSTEPNRYIPAGLPRFHVRDRSAGARLPHY